MVMYRIEGFEGSMTIPVKDFVEAVFHDGLFVLEGQSIYPIWLPMKNCNVQ